MMAHWRWYAYHGEVGAGRSTAQHERRAYTGICEERGSGIDKVVFLTKLSQLPAPFFEMTETATRAVLFAHKELRDDEAGGPPAGPAP